MALRLQVPDGTEEAAEAAAEAEAVVMALIARVADGDMAAVAELGAALKAEAEARRRLDGLRLVVTLAKRAVAARELPATERAEMVMALQRAGLA